jgi:hypothetical protein
MKKIILIAAIAALSADATAQINIGLQVGTNLANIKGEETTSGSTTSGYTKPKFGFLAGIVAEVPITHALSFRPELNFIQKGYNLNYNGTLGGVKISSTGDGTFNYVELPLNFIYSIPAGKNIVFFGVGPSAGYGISGKYTYNYTATGPDSSIDTRSGKGKVKFDGKKDSELSAGDTDRHVKALDIGGTVLIGYKMMNGIYFQTGFTLGLNNLDPNPTTSLKTNGVCIKLGYMFSKKGNK